MSKGTPGVRYAEIERETSETRIRVVLDLDGGTKQDIHTGVPFFDHMLELMAFHGHIDLGIDAEGDLDVDDHHLVEDVGIVLGQAIKEAMRENDRIARYGQSLTPMDETLAMVAVDVSGRPYLRFEVPFKRTRLGALSTENVKEFFKGLVNHAGITLHVQIMAGKNDHHLCEAVFKGFGRAIREATTVTERKAGSSTKGKRD